MKAEVYWVTSGLSMLFQKAQDFIWCWCKQVQQSCSQRCPWHRTHLQWWGEPVPRFKLRVHSQPRSQAHPSEDVNICANLTSLLALVNGSKRPAEATGVSWSCCFSGALDPTARPMQIFLVCTAMNPEYIYCVCHQQQQMSQIYSTKERSLVSYDDT